MHLVLSAVALVMGYYMALVYSPNYGSIPAVLAEYRTLTAWKSSFSTKRPLTHSPSTHFPTQSTSSPTPAIAIATAVVLPDNDHWFSYLPHRPSKLNRSHTLFAYEFPNRTSRFQKSHPQLSFIKGGKVGGTSVVVSLDQAARHYGIALATEENLGSMWFHHGVKAEWMPHNIPHVRFITMLRDPVPQTLSWYTFEISRQYYLNYPEGRCEAKAHPLVNFDVVHSKSELMIMLRSVSQCEDTEFRRNVTMQLIAIELNSKLNADIPVYHGFKWMTAGSVQDVRNSQAVINVLQRDYFLVAVTEHVNDLLVLLAWHMGWELSSMYYLRCKATDLGITQDAFRARFPELMQSLEQAMAPAREVYLTMKQEFELELALVYLQHPHLVKAKQEFEAGLAGFQNLHHENMTTPHMQWLEYIDKSGERLYC
ncbi:hypothetical protein BASA81_010806 [Batrachochytrium salamandrivorans]|nr:hypothetical protein BASA81_010806 [Batrachochytrium salamandrivorans]